MIKEALSYVRGVNGSAPRYGAHMDLDRRGGVGGAHMGLDGFCFFLKIWVDLLRLVS